MPEFLQGFDLTGVTLPTYVNDDPAVGLDATMCKVSHQLVTPTNVPECWGSNGCEYTGVPLTVGCGAGGEYEIVSGDVNCGACTPIDNLSPSVMITCTTPSNSRPVGSESMVLSGACDDSSDETPWTFSSDATICTARTCTPKSELQLLNAGFVAETSGGSTKGSYGALSCATGYRSTGTPNIMCPNQGGDFELSGCEPITCEGTPQFLSGLNLTGVTLPPNANADTVIVPGICAADAPVSAGTVPWEVDCTLEGQYVAIAGDMTCSPCTDVENRATIFSFPCVSPHEWVPAAAGYCDSSGLHTESECVIENVWTPPTSGFCEDPQLTTEPACKELRRWKPVADAQVSPAVPSPPLLSCHVMGCNGLGSNWRLEALRNGPHGLHVWIDG